MQKRATIRDVAHLAGVSVSTVSVALNRNSKVRVSESMRHRILEAVRELKYRPAGVGRPADFRRNPQLRSAREKLAVLVDGVYDSLGDNIYSQVQRGIGLAAAPAGKEVVLLNESSGYLPYGTAGVIIIGALSADKLRLAGDCPQVRAMGLLEPGESCDHVTYNNREMARLGAEYLIGRHDCIGCLCYNGREIFMQRYEIMKRMIRAAGKRLVPLFEETENCYSPDTLEVTLQRYFSGPVRPTALYIMSDFVTAMAYPILYEMGIRPGREVEIVTCDNEFARIATLRPYPTVIDIRALDIGRLAALQLLNKLRYPGWPSLQLEVLPTLIRSADWKNDWEQRLSEP